MDELSLYITDKTGRKWWRTTVTYGFHQGELRNLERHLANVKAGLKAWNFVDAASARLVSILNGQEITVSATQSTATAMPSDEDLLKDLQ